jgi:hypothetical protein
VFSFDTQTADRSTWPDTSWHAYQNINFISEDASLYLVGTAKKDTIDYEVIDLYQLNSHPDHIIELQQGASQTFLSTDTISTFEWGGGTYRTANGLNRFLSTHRNIPDTLMISNIALMI